MKITYIASKIYTSYSIHQSNNKCSFFLFLLQFDFPHFKFKLDNDEKANRKKEKSREKDRIKVELCRPQVNIEDPDFNLPEIDQIYADFGFSYENIELLDAFYQDYPELKIGLKTDTKEDKIIAVIHFGLLNLRDPSKNTKEAAVEFKNRLSAVIMENDPNGVYSERLNLG